MQIERDNTAKNGSGLEWKTCFAQRLSSSHRHTCPARDTKPGPLTAQGHRPPVSFAPSRCGRGQRASQTQVKAKDGASPGQHPLLGHARGCASATCAEHSPARTLCSLGEAAIKIARHAARAAPKTLAFGRPLPALAASQPKDGERHYDVEERRYHPQE